jgi:hypothetical protein
MAVDTLTIEEKPGAKSTVRKTVAVWYHDSDIELAQALDPHLRLLSLRMGFVLYYFGYPEKDLKVPTLAEENKKSTYYVEKYETEKAQYEKWLGERKDRYNKAVNALEHYCALFVPCVSNACMLQLGRDTERDTKLASLFVQPEFQIMPVLFRPTNTGEANLGEPLSANTGHQLELACRQIAIKIEQVLRTSSNYQPMSRPAPLATLLLTEPAPSVVDQKKHRWSLFR